MIWLRFLSLINTDQVWSDRPNELLHFHLPYDPLQHTVLGVVVGVAGALLGHCLVPEGRFMLEDYINMKA